MQPEGVEQAEITHSLLRACCKSSSNLSIPLTSEWSALTEPSKNSDRHEVYSQKSAIETGLPGRGVLPINAASENLNDTTQKIHCKLDLARDDFTLAGPSSRLPSPPHRIVRTFPTVGLFLRSRLEKASPISRAKEKADLPSGNKSCCNLSELFLAASPSLAHKQKMMPLSPLIGDIGLVCTNRDQLKRLG